MRLKKIIATEQGRAAYQEGKRRLSNPYNFFSMQTYYYAWDAGWVEEWQKVNGKEKLAPLS
jgi:hypothetical protein